MWFKIMVEILERLVTLRNVMYAVPDFVPCYIFLDNETSAGLGMKSVTILWVITDGG